MERRKLGHLFVVGVLLSISVPSKAQMVTATLGGHVTDPSGGAVPKAVVTAVNTATAFSRSAQTSDTGDYLLSVLPVGEYTVAVEIAGFRREAKSVTLQVGGTVTLDFSLQLGSVSQQVEVKGTPPVVEPTRTQVSTVISQNQIHNLPVNGRQFIDFVLLSPAVQIGDTTSGSTDVIVEPVTKLSFAGQNIHYNYIAVDGADDISTASGIQRATPPQAAVQEFRVVNTDFTTEFGRAVGGIVNIITKGGTNEWHGSVYEFFRNNKLDATSILQPPGLNKLRQNQFGGTLGGPLQKEKTFIFGNYEGQRRRESPFFNSVVLANIDAINRVKVNTFGLPPEPAGLNVTRDGDQDNGFVRLDRVFSNRHVLFTRYFITDARLTKQSPLNDGFDLPSAFKDNFIRDQSLVTNLTTTFSPRMVNELRGQWSRRSFDFVTGTTQPHLEVANTFTVGVNRGNPDFYRETRSELVDNFTVNLDRHTIQFGGNYNFVRTTESFPIFFPFEADFPSLDAFLGTGAFATTGPAPFVIFFERFQAPNFTEPSFDPAVFQGSRIPAAVRNQAKATLDHTYDGLFIQDKWRATSRLTLTGGLRWQLETWPSRVLNDRLSNFDPRIGLAYNGGTSRNVVVRAGFGLFHGIIPSPLLMGQICCGGLEKFPGRDNEDDFNGTTQIFAFASAPFITGLATSSLLKGIYPDAAPLPFCPGGVIAGCGFLGDATIVRFAKDHKVPYGVQTSIGVEFEPLPETALSISYLRVKGVHLGSFFNVNQPLPSARVLAHTADGSVGCKNVYFSNAAALDPNATCGAAYPAPTTPLFPGVADPQFAVFFEADSLWNSVFDGLLVNMNKRLSHHFSYGISYTFSHTIDDGPNPSFVLIPQDSRDIRAERANSSDDIRQRFVANATIATSSGGPLALRDWELGTIVTLQSASRFSKFAGSDVNGDVFGANDRVGIEPRNTFVGEPLKTVDLRISRVFPVTEKTKLEVFAEAFNLFNRLNVKFFNTVYGAADFCPIAGPNVCGTGPFFREGSPNPLFGSPRAVFNPRQIQFALRLTF